MLRTITLAAVVLAGTVGVAACSSTPSARPSSTASATAAPTSAVTATNTATSPASTHPSTSTAATSATPSVRPVTCTARDLSITDAGTDKSRSGTAYGTIAARNITSGTCTITGYPGVTLLSGGPTPTTLSRAPGLTPHTVALAPGSSASFGFSHKAYGKAAHCDPIDGARIYDPDGSGYQVTDTSFTECEGITAQGLLPVPITVGPFEAGTSASLA